jgi:hypothetical protein
MLENMEYDEMNKLIGLFMGYQILHKKYQTQTWCSSNESTWDFSEGFIVCDINGHEVDDNDNEPYFYIEDLPFKNSWDWLMPVVKKIYDFKDIDKYKESDGWYAYYGLETFLFSVDIESVYLKCVEFIIWYNNIFTK